MKLNQRLMADLTAACAERDKDVATVIEDLIIAQLAYWNTRNATEQLTTLRDLAHDDAFPRYLHLG